MATRNGGCECAGNSKLRATRATQLSTSGAPTVDSLIAALVTLPFAAMSIVTTSRPDRQLGCSKQLRTSAW